MASIDPSERSPVKRGWTWIVGAAKWHYFNNNNRSLCGKWYLFALTDLEDSKDNSPNNCVACKREVEKLRLEEIKK